MWRCADCEKDFEFGYITDIKLVCPFCGSCNINEYGPEFYFPKMDGLIPNVGKDSFPKVDMEKEVDKLIDEIIGSDEMPEHPNCPCYIGPELDNDTIDYMRKNVMMQSPLSFDDLDINEIVLLGLNLEEGEEAVRPYTYITDMNSRFLHTFIDADFVPV